MLHLIPVLGVCVLNQVFCGRDYQIFREYQCRLEGTLDVSVVVQATRFHLSPKIMNYTRRFFKLTFNNHCIFLCRGDIE